jgi:hypothetical protein
VNDSYDPDWLVSVDGVSAPMITVEGVHVAFYEAAGRVNS